MSQHAFPRRSLLTAMAAVGTASLVVSGCSAEGSEESDPAPANHARDPLYSEAHTRLVLLGTAGGPNWWNGGERAGVASAVAVGEKYYLIDAGHGVGRQIKRARLGTWDVDLKGPLDALQAVFLTHLHSDHICDLNNVLNNGVANGLGRGGEKVQVWGPGNRGQLPPVSGGGPVPPPVAPENPTPGTRETVALMKRTYATDFNDRMFDNHTPHVDELFEGFDVPIPAQYLADPNRDPHPRMRPIKFYEDDRVSVSATLVQHAPVFPALAYRFDTDEGSIVFSGDTGPSENLIELATRADILVHEVMAGEWVAAGFPHPRSEQDEAVFQHMVRSHTLIEEVGSVAERAGVGTLVLNHFAPSTWPVEKWEAAKEGFSGRLVVGSDLDQIGVGVV